jgi:hypothetical protein
VSPAHSLHAASSGERARGWVVEFGRRIASAGDEHVAIGEQSCCVFSSGLPPSTSERKRARVGSYTSALEATAKPSAALVTPQAMSTLPFMSRVAA